MSTLYDVSGAMLEVVSAEFTENKIKGLKYYHAVCKCNNNTVLITKNVTTVDYDIVEDVLNNIYESHISILETFCRTRIMYL